MRTTSILFAAMAGDCVLVNARDWVPETPFLFFQTRLLGFNTVNPFNGIKGALKKQKWPVRGALNYMYGRMNRPFQRASRRMQRGVGQNGVQAGKKYCRSISNRSL